MTILTGIEEFRVEYEKLNDKQKEAVDTVEGPVMVIAGPGTGKTQILSRRVANILINHDANPEDIVCLTYTEAGASEMLDRLEKLLGSQGRNVRVSTIHSFCSSLILSNPDYFENYPKVISTAVQYEILKEVMDENIQNGDVLYNNSNKRYSSKDQLLDLFSRMKKQFLDKTDIKKEVDEYLKSIELSTPEDALFSKFWYGKKGNKKSGKEPYSFHDVNFEKEVRKFDKLLSGSEIIEKYRLKLSAQNYFDFDDMILWTKDMLEKNPEFQKSVSESIEYLFVDEFQDTSVVQNELVNLLVVGKDRPNIFVVGDDDQSIYRFQGVSATNIEDFGKKYKPIQIVLEENYRSSQIILDAAKEVISSNPRKDKQLRAVGEYKDYNQKPTLTKYTTESDEMLGVLNEVKALISKGVTPKEIGIIYGRNAYGEKLAKLFKANGVPVYIKLDEDLFSDRFFKKLHSILRYVSRPNRNIKELKRILYFDFFDVSDLELMELNGITDIKEVKSSKIIKLDKEFEKIRFKLSNSKQYLSPMYFLQQIVKVFGIDTYIMKSKEKYHLISVLTSLYELMMSEVILTPGLTLSNFLEKLSGLKDMYVSLPINQLATSPDNCVNLMTAHGSKGLEFDYVFMVKCNGGKKTDVGWPGGENNAGSFSYPPSLTGKSDNESELKEQENRRLFYVAMTRAKKELHFSYSEDWKLTGFLKNLEDYLVEREPNQLTEIADKDKSMVTVTPINNKVLSSVTSDFSLSVSTLNSFLSCPLSFYFGKILNFSSEPSEPLTFGNIIHSTLEGIYISDADDLHTLSEKSVASKDETLKRFEEIYERESWKLPHERARKDDKARGISIIENFYNAADYLKPGIVAVEKNIKGIKLSDIKNTSVDLSDVGNFEINGKIDKIEVDDDIIRVIDYKTGDPKKAAKKLMPPSEKNEEGEDYWRQAVFYYILVTNSDIDLDDKKVRIQYVFVEDNNDPRGFSETTEFDISAEEVDIVLNQVKETLLKIKNGDFTTGCGDLEKIKKPNGLEKYPCEFCGLALFNNGPVLDNSEATEAASYKESVKSYKSLSVSTLNRFLNCANSYYFDNVLKLSSVAGLKPSAKQYESKVKLKHAPTGPVFGSVMHETMERIYKNGLNLNSAIVEFDKSLSIHESEIIDTMSSKDMKTYGHNLLKNLFDDYIPSSCKDVELEKDIHVTLEDNVSINGILDKIEFDGDTIRVVDYKTGTAQHGIEELEKGGNYWRQAVFYNLLLMKSSLFDTTDKKIETQYIFLDDNSNELGYSIHTIQINDEDIAIVESQINDFWQRVRQADFSSGCQKDDCDFCRLAEYVNFTELSGV